MSMHRWFGLRDKITRSQSNTCYNTQDHSASQHLLVTSFSRGRNFYLFLFIFFWNKTNQKMTIYIIFSFFPMVFHFFKAILSDLYTPLSTMARNKENKKHSVSRRSRTTCLIWSISSNKSFNPTHCKANNKHQISYFPSSLCISTSTLDSLILMFSPSPGQTAR